MTKEKTNLVSRDDQFNTIRIFNFAGKNIEGTFSNNIYGDDKVFLNLTSLILMIEDCMNVIGFPQNMAKYRKLEDDEFTPLKRQQYKEKDELKVPLCKKPESWNDREPLVTIKFRVLFRTMSGWQGEAECIENQDEIQFKSDMQFIRFVLNELETANSEETAISK